MVTEEEQEQKIQEINRTREKQARSETSSAPFLPSLKCELLKAKCHEFLENAIVIRRELAALSETTSLEPELEKRCNRLVLEVTMLGINIMTFMEANTIASDEFIRLRDNVRLLNSEVVSITSKIIDNVRKHMFPSPPKPIEIKPHCPGDGCPICQRKMHGGYY